MVSEKILAFITSEVLCIFIKSSGELLQEAGEPTIATTAVAGQLEQFSCLHKMCVIASVLCCFSSNYTIPCVPQRRLGDVCYHLLLLPCINFPGAVVWDPTLRVVSRLLQKCLFLA